MNAKKVIIVSAIAAAFVIALAIVITLISSRGSILGKYSDVEIGIGTTLEFDKSSVKVTYMSGGEIVDAAEGTYETSGNKITFTLKGSTPYISSGIYEFSLAEDKITIDGKEYKKTE